MLLADCRRRSTGSYVSDCACALACTSIDQRLGMLTEDIAQRPKTAEPSLELLDFLAFAALGLSRFVGVADSCREVCSGRENGSGKYTTLVLEEVNFC